MFYYDYDNEKPMIAFSTTMHVNKNYYTDLGNEAIKLGFEDFSDNFNLFANDILKLEIHQTENERNIKMYIVAVSYR